MRVIKMETRAGVIQSIQFQSDAETPAVFKQAILDWITANYPSVTLQQVFMRITQVTPSSIMFDMT